MFHLQTILDYQHQRHEEFLKEAAQKQLAAIARSGRDKQRPRYYETLSALGRRMVNWGEQLQARYSPSELITTSETVR